MLTVTVRYTDGDEVTVPADAWPDIRADGVGEVVVRAGTGTTWDGLSLYWLYREGAAYVVGGAAVGYRAEQPPEILYWDDGSQTDRFFDYLPDLPHSGVKLGWWWPGKERPPWP